MATRSVKSGTQMCVVSLDFTEYLLPLSKGLALVDLMQHAVKCDARYGNVGLSKTVWTEADPPRLELEAVSTGNIKPKPPEAELDEAKF
jgi:hypothetical protein